MKPNHGIQGEEGVWRKFPKADGFLKIDTVRVNYDVLENENVA